MFFKLEQPGPQRDGTSSVAKRLGKSEKIAAEKSGFLSDFRILTIVVFLLLQKSHKYIKKTHQKQLTKTLVDLQILIQTPRQCHSFRTVLT